MFIISKEKSCGVGPTHKQFPCRKSPTVNAEQCFAAVCHVNQEPEWFSLFTAWKKHQVIFLSFWSLSGDIYLQRALAESSCPYRIRTNHSIFLFIYYQGLLHVNHPHALQSMFDFDFVGLGCGILTFSVIILNFSLL